MKIDIAILLGLSLLVSCTPDPTSSSTSMETPERSPEEVVRQWQGHIDQNQFEAAKMLSDTGTIAWIETIQALTKAFPDDSSIMTTEFISIACQTQQQTASCACLLKDVEMNAQYPDTFDLVLTEGRWLVTLPPSAIDDTSDMLEQLFEELEREDAIQ
jgi:hypothetical protein